MKKLGFVMALMAIMLVGVAYGATTFVTPAASGVMSGSYFINITSTTLNNISNCTVTGSSALTGDSFTVEANASDAEAGLQANVTYSTAARVDASDWVLTGTCYNLTLGTTEAITSRTVTIDNTRPTCTTSGIVTNTEYKPDKTWTLAGINATSATIAFGSNQPYTMKEATTGDSFTYKGEVPNGLYTVKAITSDGYNTTTCTLVTGVSVHSDEAGKLAIGLVDNSQKQAAKSNGTLILLIGAIGLLIYAKAGNK